MGLGFTRVRDHSEDGKSTFWKKARYEDVPRGALLAGIFQGKEQFIGKYNSDVKGCSFVGPVFLDKGLTTVYGKSNKFFHSYEIFMKNADISWKAVTGNSLPDGAIPSVETIHGFGYIGRHSKLGVGMVIYKKDKWVILCRNNIITDGFEVLCQQTSESN